MKILVTLDGSHFGEAIIGTVATLAKPLGATVELLSVIQPDQATGTRLHSVTTELTPMATPSGTRLRVPAPTDLIEPPAESRAQALARMDDSLHDYLKTCARELDGVDTQVTVEFADHAAEAIIAHARRERPDLIAMATHGRTGLSHLLTGSVCEQVLRSGVAPVLVLRP